MKWEGIAYGLYPDVVCHFSMKSGFLISGLMIGLASCKLTNFVGRYELRHSSKTSMEVKNDGTFEFTQINPNPYLHPFEHPDEYYFTTFGTWTAEKKTLTFNSFKDSIADRQPEIIFSKEITRPIDKPRPSPMFLDSDGSRFTFYDIFGDTVNILFVQSPDSNRYSALHRTMELADWPASYADTVEFYFYGYKPFTFIRTDKVRREIGIKLYPEYRYSVFNDIVFRVTRRKIKRNRITLTKRN